MLLILFLCQRNTLKNPACPTLKSAQHLREYDSYGRQIHTGVRRVLEILVHIRQKYFFFTVKSSLYFRNVVQLARMRLLRLLVGVLQCALLLGEDRTVIQTTDGLVRGETLRSDLGKEVDVWERIPYAEPPVGELRSGGRPERKELEQKESRTHKIS